MSKFSALAVVFGMALAVAPALPAFAQDQAPSPRQIQTMIETGQSGQAVQALKGVLAQHPDSGVGWYLMAEAQDAHGHEAVAAQALAKADHYAPGLPFADPQAAEALRAHINNGLKASDVRHGGGGVSIVLMVIVGLIALFVLLRIVAGWGRRPPMSPPYPGSPNAPYGGYGPNGPYPYGQGGGPVGGGLGSSIITGLAAGAGFAAGERIVDGLMGGQNAQAAQQPGPQDFPAGPQDDGLSGDPGWGGDDDNLNSDSW